MSNRTNNIGRFISSARNLALVQLLVGVMLLGGAAAGTYYIHEEIRADRIATEASLTEPAVQQGLTSSDASPVGAFEGLSNPEDATIEQLKKEVTALRDHNEKLQAYADDAYKTIIALNQQIEDGNKKFASETERLEGDLETCRQDSANEAGATENCDCAPVSEQTQCAGPNGAETVSQICPDQCPKVDETSSVDRISTLQGRLDKCLKDGCGPAADPEVCMYDGVPCEDAIRRLRSLVTDWTNRHNAIEEQCKAGECGPVKQDCVHEGVSCEAAIKRLEAALQNQSCDADVKEATAQVQSELLACRRRLASASKGDGVNIVPDLESGELQIDTEQIELMRDLLERDVPSDE